MEATAQVDTVAALHIMGAIVEAGTEVEVTEGTKSQIWNHPFLETLHFKNLKIRHTVIVVK